MKFRNLTQRIIRVYDDFNREVLCIEPENISADSKIETILVDEINGVKIVDYKYSDVRGLPEPEKDTIFIVSFSVLQALGGTRKDVVSPDTSPTSAIREKGRLFGVRALRSM